MGDRVMHDPAAGPTHTVTPLEVRQVRSSLEREFADLIDMDDCPSGDPVAAEQQFLSRALAAKAVRLLTDRGPQEAAEAIVTGADDGGIDAVGFSLAAPEIWLVQAKWSDTGTAGFGAEDAQKLLQGLRGLSELQYHRFNRRFQRLIGRVDEVLRSPQCRIHLVVAVMGDGSLSRRVESMLADTVAEFGVLDAGLLDVRVLGIADFHSAARQDADPEPVSVTATLTRGWHATTTPYTAYVGAVAVEELADWYQHHGERLFAQNLRRYLGMTKVNQGLVTSLIENPHDFWYFNNGITVLCDSLRTEFFARRAEGHPVRLELVNARVVNGAQTVSSVYHAFEKAGETVAEATVSIRVICVDGAPEGLAARITETTNTQNHMEARDFVALDPQQALIREDFALSLGKEYVYRRGALVPSPATGCSVVEAATALACAHPNPSFAARVRADGEFLWRQAPEGAYTQLFARRPGARQIWRSVQLLRRVSQVLHEMAPSLPARARTVSDHGSLLVAHVVFQEVGGEGIDEADGAWEARLDSVLERTGEVLSLLIALVDRLYGPYVFLSSTFTDARRCRELAQAVRHALARDEDADALAPPVPPRTRRADSVGILIDRGRIAEGARLVYRPGAAEERDVGDWLSEDPNRYLATWVNDARRPLLWAADGKRYSPSGLVVRIWDEAGWEDRPVAVRGTRYWILPGEGSLVELADRIRAESGTGDGSSAD